MTYSILAYTQRTAPTVRFMYVKDDDNDSEGSSMTERVWRRDLYTLQRCGSRIHPTSQKVKLERRVMEFNSSIKVREEESRMNRVEKNLYRRYSRFVLCQTGWEAIVIDKTGIHHALLSWRSGNYVCTVHTSLHHMSWPELTAIKEFIT